MINRDRLVGLFTELVEIDSPSLGEREICTKLKERLAAIGINSYEDDTAAKIGGSAGNLYAYIDGSINLKPILLSAHMDTVEPSRGKSTITYSDGTITSDGTTVLGADDLSGVAVILEVLTVLQEKGIPHRPIEVLFDVSEETYCTGIQQFNFPSLKSKEAYVLDLSGPVGNAAFQAPSIVSFSAEFRGRAAHAAFSPETGIHAIKAAAKAVTLIWCGRVGDTTVNVGKISGGSVNHHFFHHGIRGLVVASGMNNCHSCEEYTSISELEKAANTICRTFTPSIQAKKS